MCVLEGVEDVCCRLLEDMSVAGCLKMCVIEGV